MTREEIVEAIRRTAADNGGTALGRARFEKVTGIKESDWSGRYWARWSDAVLEAGFTPNRMNDPLPDEAVLAALAELVRELGRFPTNAELKMRARIDPDFPAANTIRARGGGSKAGLARRLLEFCEAKSDLVDVASICRSLVLASGDDDEEDDGLGKSSVGYVYLMKMGRYYKIGRSNAVGRRHYEVGLKMPEKVVIVHELETDDPAGIEAYWHNRFADRRREGEWFNLSAEDVRAFRRRGRSM